MNRPGTIVIFGILAFGLMTIIMLMATTPKPFRYRQHFMRNHRLNSMTLKARLAVTGDYYIAGIASGQFYFGNKTTPLSLMVTDSQLNVIEYLHLPLQNMNRQELAGSYIEVDHPTIYLKAGDLPGIYVTDTNNTRASAFHKVPYFQRAVPISPALFALQAKGSEKGAGVLSNLLLVVPAQASLPHKVKALSADINSYFSSQGILRYCPDLNRLVYIHYYHNEITVMDTSLNVLYSGTTIDTISHIQIKPHEVEGGFYSMASTSAVVNLDAQVSGGELYVHSNLMAVNDDRGLFDNASAIDVYNLETLEYKYSFFVPDRNNTKVKSFQILNNNIVAVYPNTIALYDHKDIYGQSDIKLRKKYFTDQ